MSYAETDLEKEFEKLYADHNQEIQDKLKEASRLIDEAVKLSEQYGLPFKPEEDIMWCNPSYLPHSFKGKFPELDEEFVYTVTDASGYWDYGGWQSSQTC
jgi:site-specific DNA-adenine methylase